MTVGVCLRTRNEHKNIERFCSTYSWADKIMIADGGSDDDTVELAKKFPNVEIRYFTEFVTNQFGGRQNHEGHHLEFLFNWAKEEKVDWIVSDDCDSIPNREMKKLLPGIFSDADKDGKVGIRILRIYLYLDDRWFPSPSKHDWWAWKLSVDVGLMVGDGWGYNVNNFPSLERCVILDCPYALLHYSSPTEERVQEKLKFYYESGMVPLVKSVQELFGQPKPILEWMVE